VQSDAPGCLVIPALIIVVPVRLLWEVLSAIGRFTRAYVLRPLGRLVHAALLRPLWWILRRPVWWVLRVLVLAPLRWVTQRLLVPLGRMILRHVLRPAWIALVRVVAVIRIPFVFAARWIGRGLAVLWRGVWPLLAAFGRFFASTWHLAGVVLFTLLIRPVRLMWRVLVRPVLGALRRAWQMTVRPAARWLRTQVWEPVLAAGRSVSRALGLDARRH
jgi:hypothetical protein